MRTLALLTILACAGCLRQTAYHCSSDADCVRAGSPGHCEVGYSFCSFDDSSCTSGRKFGDLSDKYSQTCVGDLPLVDAGLDGPRSDGSGDAQGNDLDGDGVPNATDNCPMIANADQGNEDGDAFGDVCDPCPPISDNNPSDMDTDGVADAYDPNPGTPGDAIFLFEGFHQGIPATWENVGSFTAATDDATALANGNNVAYLTTPGPVTGHETVSTSVVVDSFTTQINTVGIVDDKRPAADSSIACGVFHAPVAPSPGLALVDTNNLAGYTPVTYQMTAGQTYALKQKRDLTAYACNASNGAAAAMVSATYSLANNPPSVGFRLSNARAHYHWLMVVTSP
jgi:hypothetical protein